MAKKSQSELNKDRLKNANQAKVFREQVLKEQNGIDPILEINITRPVLDHQHFPPFKCRGVLQSEVNAFEGKIYNAYRRYIKHLTDKSITDVLRAMIVYLERDSSKNPIHHTGICDEVRPFKRVNAEMQIKVLKTIGIDPGPSLSKRVRQLRGAIQEGKINYETLIKLLNGDKGQSSEIIYD